MSTIPACATCRFWQPENDKASEAQCCRHAPYPAHLHILADILKAVTGIEDEPVVSSEVLRLTPYWPVTSADDGCGDHRCKKDTDNNEQISYLK